MAEQDVLEAARELKAAHLRADALGGEHQAAAAQAYANLLDAVGEVDEPEEVKAYRAEVEDTTRRSAAEQQQPSAAEDNH